MHLSASLDKVIVHLVEPCEHCQHYLHEIQAQQIERRQVIDLPPRRVEMLVTF